MDSEEFLAIIQQFERDGFDSKILKEVEAIVPGWTVVYHAKAEGDSRTLSILAIAAFFLGAMVQKAVEKFCYSSPEHEERPEEFLTALIEKCEAGEEQQVQEALYRYLESGFHPSGKPEEQEALRMLLPSA